MQITTRRAALATGACLTLVAAVLGVAGAPGGGMTVAAVAAVAAVIQMVVFFTGGGAGNVRTAVEGLAFHSSKDAIFLLDGPRIVECNESLLKMLGASSRDQALRLTPPDFSPQFQPDGRPSGDKAMELIDSTLRSGFNRFEWLHQRLDGTPLPCSVTLVAVAIGGKTYLLVFLHEIGDLVEARESARKVLSERQQMQERLAASFERRVKDIVTVLAGSVGQIRSTASDLVASADESRRGIESAALSTADASMGMEAVASASAELTASINEISRRVAESAAITREAADEAQNTNATIDGLSTAADKIGEIVGLITDIASQTNLLALNATIEAARAGEAGKGFAVVANEVKHLANQTAKATEDISSQISSIQSQTRLAVDAIRHIGSTISHIDEMAAAIAAAVEEQGAATNEIARNVESAAGSTRSASDNLGQIAQLSQRTETMARTVTTLVGTLSEDSGRLDGEVHGFLSEVRSG